VLDLDDQEGGKLAVSNARRILTRAALLVALTGALLLVLATPAIAGRH